MGAPFGVSLGGSNGVGGKAVSAESKITSTGGVRSPGRTLPDFLDLSLAYCEYSSFVSKAV